MANLHRPEPRVWFGRKPRPCAASQLPELLCSAELHFRFHRYRTPSIAACLIAVTVTGIALDRGRSIGIMGAPAIVAAQADNARRDRGAEERSSNAEEGEGGRLGEVHEVLSNLLTVLVGLHIAYLLAFKWKLERFMLFFPTAKRRD